MLVQTYRREVPDHDAFIERTLLRDVHFCVAVVRARRLVLDPGALGVALGHLGRFRRPQVTVMLSGRGYLDVRGRIVELGPGDVVESDQRSHAGEGYGGDDCMVVIVDWDDGGIFAGATPSACCRMSRLSPPDVAHLRTLVGELGSKQPEIWVTDLARALRAGGLRVAPSVASDIASAPGSLVRVYRVLGSALSRLDAQPSIDDVAANLAMSPRHVLRLLGELSKGYDHPFEGWRDLIHEMRLAWATQLMSLPGLPVVRVARLAGYRSDVALHHALSLRGGATPSAIARRLAERWR